VPLQRSLRPEKDDDEGRKVVFCYKKNTSTSAKVARDSGFSGIPGFPGIVVCVEGLLASALALVGGLFIVATKVEGTGVRAIGRVNIRAFGAGYVGRGRS
jgi:hypothetical protein